MVVAAVVAAVVRNGLWATPNLSFFVAISRNLGSNPFSEDMAGDYLLTNVTGPALAALLGATEPHRYVALHLALLLIGIGAVLASVLRRFGPTAMSALALALCIAPVTTTSLEWLGQPDAITLPLAMGLVVARRPWSVLALAILLGLTHAEQGLFIAVTVAVARAVLDDQRPVTIRRVGGSAAVPALGVVIGGGAVRAWYWLGDVTIRTDRASFLDLGFDAFVTHHTAAGLWPVVAAWGLGWLGIAALVGRWNRHRSDPNSVDLRRRLGWLGAAALGAVVPTLLTLDQTRVYGLITSPLVVAAAVLAVRDGRRMDARLVAAAVVVATVVPGSFTAGELYGRWDLPVRDFVGFLVDGEHPGGLTEWLWGPFGFEVPGQ